MAIQEPNSNRVHQYLLPVPVEGTRLCVNVTIEGAQQRPVVTICWQQIVETIRDSDSVPRAEPPPLIPINDDGDSDTTVELILNELDQAPESDGDIEQSDELIQRRPTPWPRTTNRKQTLSPRPDAPTTSHGQQSASTFTVERFPRTSTPPLLERIRQRGYLTKSDLDEREKIIERTLQRLRGTSRPLSPGERRRLIEEGRRLRERPSSNTPRVNPLRKQKRTSPKK